MSTRASLLALAAIATLATAALAATDASAAQFTVNHSGGHFGSHYHPYPICSWGCHREREHGEDEREHRWWGWNHHPIYRGTVAVASVGGSVAAAGAPGTRPVGRLPDQARASGRQRALPGSLHPGRGGIPAARQCPGCPLMHRF